MSPISSTAALSDYVEKVLAAAPPLTGDQRSKLAELMRAARHEIVANRTAQARLAELDSRGAA